MPTVCTSLLPCTCLPSAVRILIVASKTALLAASPNRRRGPIHRGAGSLRAVAGGSRDAEDTPAGRPWGVGSVESVSL